MELKCFLVDFCGTLSNSLYFNNLSKEIKHKIDSLLFINNESNEIDNKWMKGELNYIDILKYLSNSIPFPFIKLKKSLLLSANKFKLNENIKKSLINLKKNNIYTVCVTINTDIFKSITVKRLNLSKYFDFIINSNDYNTTDKNKLCKIAIKKINNKIKINECILIDDKIKNIINFKNLGGNTYHYQCDKKYKQWFSDLKTQHNGT